MSAPPPVARKPAGRPGLSARPDAGTCRELVITYLVPGVPPRSTFRVDLGPDGRVARISDPRTWD